ncbi:MAG TPA: metal-dependent hydrolase [Vicinamibacterales bacterium]|nr:metal-dependent hydrolase [Vicinamibacterales bacterium]
MFIGHFALGLAAKRATPRVSLALLFGAAQLADLLWPVFLATGLEQVRIDPGNTAFTPLDFVSYPYSHSLLLLLVWGVLLALLSRPFTRGRRVFAVIAALVASHWLLDFVTHRPDMPLYPGGAKFGLGLWNSIPATAAIEVPLFAAGVWIYSRVTHPRDRTGKWAFGSLIVTLLLIYVANIFSPPPPSVPVLTIVAIAGGVLFTAWSGWADRHRDVA